jgi:hypothetical protein
MTYPSTRYHFNVILASGALNDYEGSELPSLDEARREALEDAKFLMSAAILEGRDISSRKIEVCNEAGDVLLVVPFREALIRDD